MDNPFIDLPDEILMEKYILGDQRAFEVIYHRYKSVIYSYVKKKIFQESHIEDVFQNVFVKFHKSREKYDSKFKLLQWLYVLAKNECLDYLKKNRDHEVEFIENDFFNDQIKKDLNIDLSNEKRLSENEKLALERKFNFDDDFVEISKKLNTNPTNVRKIVSRALRKLRAKYQGARYEE